MISKERLQGNWNSVVGAVKEKFGQITGDDLTRVEGNAEQLVALIQRKTGQTREQVEQFIDSCSTSTESAINRISEKASEYAGIAGEAVRDNYDRISEEAQRGYDYTVKTVSRRPLESVAIALGVGLLAGLTVGISMSGRRHY
jgi:uncharacterized protein YjbJ (UPF0337 family)